MGIEKYYTPTIEEFHIGFECELRNSSGESFEWELFKIVGVDDGEISGRLMDWSFYDSANAIKEGMIRVKYLDAADIEEYGWVNVTKDEFRSYVYEGLFPNSTRGKMIFVHDWLNNKITIKTPNYIRDGSGNFHGYIVYVKGLIIKNKSELKRLMKQLGI